MEGKRDDSGNIEASGAGAGIIARAVTRVFDALADSNGDNHVKISFLEIYNEVRCCKLCTPHECVWAV